MQDFFYEKFLIYYSNIKNLKIITELYGSTKKLHDYITNTKNSFQETFKGIKNLIK
jgi:hypothetical protein